MKMNKQTTRKDSIREEEKGIFIHPYQSVTDIPHQAHSFHRIVALEKEKHFLCTLAFNPIEERVFVYICAFKNSSYPFLAQNHN